jgi:hypothetical protein
VVFLIGDDTGGCGSNRSYWYSSSQDACDGMDEEDDNDDADKEDAISS